VAPYPTSPAARSDWIVARRAGIERTALDPWKPSAWLREQEPDASGVLTDILTVFLTNRECPWRCLMCDLWRHTLTEPVPPGAIPAQFDIARAADAQASATPARWLKLYNAGSFFDAAAIPPGDHRAVAERAAAFERLIVECHPALVGPRVTAFRERLPAATRLEVALGLETAHPEILARLNKRITREDFARATRFLRDHGIDVRTFVLVKPPFLSEADALDWAQRSVEFAFDCGVHVVSLIPTRGGNGALEALAADGTFSPPTLATLAAALAHGLRLGRGRVFADLWDLGRFAPPEDAARYHAQLDRMNRTQRAT
jgi:archaeosine synthase beta-subunit